MVTSALFWIVLALALPVYWLLPRTWRAGFLALVSVGYLATLQPWSVAVLVGFTLLFYYLAPLATPVRRRADIPQSGPPGREHWWIVPALILLAVGYLAYFKYLPPLLAALHGSAGGMDPAAAVFIPLGISYSTFKLIHYAVDVARGGLRERSLPQFAAYMLWFPIFSAGPIERFDHYLANKERPFSLDRVLDGLTRLSQGLVRKFFIAEIVLRNLYLTAHKGAWVGELSTTPTLSLWGMAIVSYVYLYMDFGGYTDIALGISKLFGLEIMENFDWPGLAPNISVFWKRWHMTLAGWCQSYIYMPVLGWLRNPYIAVFATFVVIGLWHSASINWILWGLYHGAGVAGYQVWARARRVRNWHWADGFLKFTAIPLTFLFVSAGELCVLGNMRPLQLLHCFGRLFFLPT